MSELIQAAKQDPQGFQQRMQQLAQSGVTPQTVTPDQIDQLIGPAPGTLPGSPLPPSPPPGNPFGGQQGGGWSPPGAPDQFTSPRQARSGSLAARPAAAGPRPACRTSSPRPPPEGSPA